MACCAVFVPGCGLREYPFWWQAAGESVAAWRMVLDEPRQRAILVLRLVLQGTEGHGPQVAAFRDEMLLVLRVNLDDQPVLGYGRRRYADGRQVSFQFQGWVQPHEQGGSDSPLRVQGSRSLLSPSGIPVPGTLAVFRMEIAPDMGRISARGW